MLKPLSTDKVVVYGSSLDAFTCVQTLLTMGVPGKNINFVQPPLQYEVGRAMWHSAPVSFLIKSFNVTNLEIEKD